MSRRSQRPTLHAIRSRARMLHVTRSCRPMTDRTSTAERVRKRREGMRAAGLRPAQIWVPDTRRPGFAAGCWRQSLSLRRDPAEREVLDWLDKVADREDWT